MNFAVCGVGGKLSVSQEKLRMAFPEARIKRVKAAEVLSQHFSKKGHIFNGKQYTKNKI